jgi:hypothetical protein
MIKEAGLQYTVIAAEETRRLAATSFEYSIFGVQIVKTEN